MSLISLLIILIVFALLIYIVDLLIPDQKIKNIVRAVLAVILVLYLLQAFLGGGPIILPLR
jgi:heme A synthase